MPQIYVNHDRGRSSFQYHFRIFPCYKGVGSMDNETFSILKLVDVSFKKPWDLDIAYEAQRIEDILIKGE